jgi:hypothetical protein
MRTPAGRECPYFYADYFRGKSQEECRLLPGPAAEKKWTRDLCARCPVPDIAQANSCAFQTLRLRVERQFLGLRRVPVVQADCSRCQCQVEQPQVGCGQCHPALPFLQIGE